MSDHDDHDHDPEKFLRHMFGLPDDDTIQKQKMALTAEVHSIYDWFNSADEESLKRVKAIVGSIINASTSLSGSLAQAAFWNGYTSAKLESNHGVCPACGVNHMDELTADET